MSRKFKTLGLVLAAVFAMSAIGASAASAAEIFHASNSPIAVTGQQTTAHVFKFNLGTVTCSIATFTGTTGGKTTTTQTLQPHYTGCKGSFISVPVDDDYCAYLFNANGTTEVECQTGKEIWFTFPGCTISVNPQHLAAGMAYETVGATPNREIKATTSIAGIEYDECGTTLTNGTYTGTTLIDANSASEEIWES